MSDVRAILVVPGAEWRERLLGDGPCGGGPPLAWRDRYDGAEWRPCEVRVPRGCESSLALAWRGKPTGPEGLARALACLAEREGWTPYDGWRGGSWRVWVRPDGTVGECAIEGLGDLLDLWALATVLVARGVAERVEVTRG
jgi:hypothetical protein